MCKQSLCHHSLQHRAPTPRPASTLALLDPQSHIWEGGAGALEPRGDAGCPCLATFGQRVALGVLLLPHPSPSWGRCLPSPVLAKVVGVARGG